MQAYRSRRRNSGVVAFSLGETSIDIMFRGGSTYRYDAAKPGIEKVEVMKRLALAGAGLSTFISQKVGAEYAAKLNAPPPSTASQSLTKPT